MALAMSLTRSAVTLPKRYHSSQSDTKRQICSIVNNKGKSTIGTETLPKYRNFSTVDVFHHSGHILFHDFFAFEGSTYSFFFPDELLSKSVNIRHFSRRNYIFRRLNF